MASGVREDYSGVGRNAIRRPGGSNLQTSRYVRDANLLDTGNGPSTQVISLV